VEGTAESLFDKADEPVRAPAEPLQPVHNEGGLAFWFIRAERYERPEGMPFPTVDERCRRLESTRSRKPPARA
jgi:hypothetical protein